MRGNGIAKRQTAVLLLLALLVHCGKEEEARDFYLVMDTSGSMSAGTMQQVRDSLPQITELMKDGDRVHLVRFDEEATLEKTIDIDKELDRSEVLRWVGGLKPKGRYTDIAGMLASLKKLQSENTPEDRQSFLIVLSDGKDDPAPNTRKETVDLGDFRAEDTPPGPSKSFVYYISLGSEKSAALEEGLAEISPEVKTIDAGNQEQGAVDGDNAATIDLSEATDDIKERSGDGGFWSWWGGLAGWVKGNWLWVLIGLAVLLLLLLLLFLWIRGRKVQMLRGLLHYWEEGTHPDLGKTVRLSKLLGKRLTLGSRPGTKIRIKDLGVDKLVLKGKTKQGVPVLKPSNAKALDFESQKWKGVISPGDTFKLGNYNFEYKDGNEKG